MWFNRSWSALFSWLESLIYWQSMWSWFVFIDAESIFLIRQLTCSYGSMDCSRAMNMLLLSYLLRWLYRSVVIHDLSQTSALLLSTVCQFTIKSFRSWFFWPSTWYPDIHKIQLINGASACLFIINLAQSTLLTSLISFRSFNSGMFSLTKHI